MKCDVMFTSELLMGRATVSRYQCTAQWRISYPSPAYIFDIGRTDTAKPNSPEIGRKSIHTSVINQHYPDSIVIYLPDQTPTPESKSLKIRIELIN